MDVDYYLPAVLTLLFLTMSLNPCYVGRWTSTQVEIFSHDSEINALILVMLDGGLVLLLILMLVRQQVSLNPCYVGRWTSTNARLRTIYVDDMP